MLLQDIIESEKTDFFSLLLTAKRLPSVAVRVSGVEKPSIALLLVLYRTLDDVGIIEKCFDI